MAMNQKMRSLLSLAVLLAVGAGAGLFAYYGVHEKQEKEKSAKELKEKLFADYDKSKLQQLTVTAKGQTTILARSKDPDGWTIISPVNAPSDKSVVDGLLDRLATVKQKMLVEEKSTDLGKFGLAQPSIKVVAKAEDGKEFVLRVGDESEFDHSMYVALGDSSDVVQAEGGFKPVLEKNTFDLRDKRVLPFEDPEAAGLEVTLDGAKVVLAKRDGKWLLEAPIADRADEQTVNRLLGSLKNLRATEFVTDTAGPADLAKVGLDKPARLEVVLLKAGGQKATLAATQSGGKTYARRHEATFLAEVPEAIFTDLAVKPGDLRDKTLLAFEKDKVAKATFTLAEGPVTLERKKPEGDAGRSEEWAITAPAPGEARKWKMNSVLWSLSSMKAAAIAEDHAADFAKYGLDKPGRSVTLFDDAGKELGTLAFGKEEGEKVYARNLAEPRVFEVEKSRLGELPSSRADLEEPAKADGGTP